MHGNVTNEEWQVFKEAYQFFSDHCLPPANQDEDAVEWWMSAAKDVGELDAKWKDYPLMRSLLLGIYEYIEFKAKPLLKSEKRNSFLAGRRKEGSMQRSGSFSGFLTAIKHRKPANFANTESPYGKAWKAFP